MTDGPAPYTASITIGGKEFTLSQISDHNVTVQAGQITDVKLKDLAAWISNEWKIGLPTELGDAELEYILLNITTAGTGPEQTRCFSFSAACGFSVEGTPVRISALDFRYEPGKFLAALDVSITTANPPDQSEMHFTGTLDKTTDDWILTAAWNDDSETLLQAENQHTSHPAGT
ncbi:hypothetical protein [Streptomyces buecherae]|uniref:Uncharacterized protein n=1 Tax=Streptomyces buecherae TaxID=2763006 RepID=A0A7H8NGG8_9ACTN|nr:hypothetical protein [Streptomyces buecherae]QKW53604.1 hypothetical protein HUT08_33200 [Streptomyces buecherae]